MRRMFSEEQLERVAQTQTKLVKKDIATLVDSNGNDRFVEGDITIQEVTGATQVFGKWSLSGTHLMIVLLISYVAGTYSGKIAIVDLPQWIRDKIVPYYDKYIALKYVPFYHTYTPANVNIEFDKNSAGNVEISFASSTTLSDDKVARIELDLLIDSD